ncbi:hypothetical protein ASF47_16260 [Nocardioides sp. Leaf285]|nr:hypothetical protein ASF47_16260 [Nocardioides sp. Leaf285]
MGEVMPSRARIATRSAGTPRAAKLGEPAPAVPEERVEEALDEALDDALDTKKSLTVGVSRQ